jgi:hypothetical protein
MLPRLARCSRTIPRRASHLQMVRNCLGSHNNDATCDITTPEGFDMSHQRVPLTLELTRGSQNTRTHAIPTDNVHRKVFQRLKVDQLTAHAKEMPEHRIQRHQVIKEVVWVSNGHRLHWQSGLKRPAHPHGHDLRDRREWQIKMRCLMPRMNKNTQHIPETHRHI